MCRRRTREESMKLSKHLQKGNIQDIFRTVWQMKNETKTIIFLSVDTIFRTTAKLMSISKILAASLAHANLYIVNRILSI